jgi:hypothetical protein
MNLPVDQNAADPAANDNGGQGADQTGGDAVKTALDALDTAVAGVRSAVGGEEQGEPATAAEPAVADLAAAMGGGPKKTSMAGYMGK